MQHIRTISYAFIALVLALAASAQVGVNAGFPSSGRIFPSSAPPAPNPKIWTFCNTLPLTPPCTVQGSVSTAGSANAVISTQVVRWQLAGINSLATFGHIQFFFHGPSSGSLSIVNAFVGAGQTTGGGKCSSNTIFCQWDFAATPTRITFSSGSNTIVIGNGPASSDVIAFVGSTSQPLMFAADFANPSTQAWVTPASTNVSPLGTPGFSSNNYNTWFLGSVQQASTVQKNSGYSSTCSSCGNKILGILQVVASP